MRKLFDPCCQATHSSGVSSCTYVRIEVYAFRDMEFRIRPMTRVAWEPWIPSGEVPQRRARMYFCRHTYRHMCIDIDVDIDINAYRHIHIYTYAYTHREAQIAIQIQIHIHIGIVTERGIEHLYT